MGLTLSRFELSVIELLLAADHPVAEALRAQLQTVSVKDRQVSTAGFFTNLKVGPTPPAPTSRRLIIDGVEAAIPGLEYGAGFILWVENGMLETLEGYTYDEPWLGHVDEFELRYPTERDLEALFGPAP